MSRTVRRLEAASPLLLLITILAFFRDDAYVVHLGILATIAALQALSLNVIWGYAGQFSMAQIALSALAAYSSSLVVMNLHIDPWLALAPAIALSMLVSVVVGALSLRFRHMHFAIATLAFGQLVVIALTNARITGGASGLSVPFGLTNITVEGITLFRVDRVGYLVIGIAFLTLLMACIAVLLGTTVGRAIVAIREEEILATALGIPVAYFKVLAFALSSIPASVAGWLFPPYITFIAPSDFGFVPLLEEIGAVVVGGPGSVAGPLLGSVLFVGLPEGLRFTGPFRLIGFSALLIVVVVYFPGGIMGHIHRIARRRRSKKARHLERTLHASPTAYVRGDRAQTNHDRTGQDLLVLENVSKRYFGLAALDGITVRIGEGTTTGLIGPNGAGKTTMFDVVTGFTKVSGGRITWLGRDMSGVPTDRRARAGLVRTFQHARVFPQLTVNENLLSATYLPGRGLLPGRTKWERCEALRELSGLDAWGDTLASDLSYGLNKLLGVAMGAAPEPRLLLLDEPAAGLHGSERERLREFLGELRILGLTLWVIEHDMEFVMKLCERVLVLSAGRLLADGAPEQVKVDPVVVDAYLGGHD
jgi:branched-chain amino acid transport system permease protein